MKRKSLYICLKTHQKENQAIKMRMHIHITDDNTWYRCGHKEGVIKKYNSRKNAWSLVQDTAWESHEEVLLHIMKGYWTQIHEITEQIISSNVDILFLQAGVGSWAASIASYIMIYWKNPPMIITENQYPQIVYMNL